MNFIDIIILIPMLWFGFKGFKKGFIIEVASIAALLLGIWGGIHFSNFVAEYISSWFSLKSDYIPLVSFSVTFLLIVILVFLVAKIVEKLIKSVGLGLPNRIAGAILGSAKIIIIISVILLLINKFDQNGTFIKNETKDNSLLYKPITNIVLKIYPSVTSSLDKIIDNNKESENKKNPLSNNMTRG